MIDSAVAAVLAAGSRARSARVFHPEGVAHRARIALDGGHGLPAGTRRGIVRLSRGIGLPDALPDLLGLAIRIDDVAGTGAHQDLLLVSSSAAFPLRHLLVPARHFARPTYSSLARFRAPDGAVVTAVARALVGSHQFELGVAEGTGAPRPAGVVVLEEQLPDAAGQALRFDVWRHAAVLEPVGWLNGLRRRAYAASQAARPDTAIDDTVIDLTDVDLRSSAPAADQPVP
jgi:hypothetical protein